MRQSKPRALEGLRVLDLTRVWAGPLCTRILGDLCADVIKIEAIWARGPRSVAEADVRTSGRYPDNQAGEKPWNREGFLNKVNRNKRSLTLQLDVAEGKELFERLVRQSDVVIENYTPRVMPQFGLGYDRLRELNSSVIYIGMPGYGWTGPSRNFAALGSTLEPEAGLSSLMGYPDSGPYKSGVGWADPVAAMHAACAVLIALVDRESDPQRCGQAIELAQLEGMICFIGEEILGAQYRGADPARRGNRHVFYAPQGCYPCTGEDRWVAISVTGDAKWAAMCAATGFGSEWSALTLDERITRHDELDQLIQSWTRERERDTVVALLQRYNVACCPVSDARDLVENPHLSAREFFAEINHPDAGRHLFPGLPIRMGETPAQYRLPAPGLGQHNREILEGMLGLPESTIEELRELGVIAEAPPG